MPKRSTLLRDAIKLLNGLSDSATAEPAALHSLFKLILDTHSPCPEQIKVIRDSDPVALSLLYEQLVNSDRRIRGIFYTPQPAAELLVDLVLDRVCEDRELEWEAPPRILDPACGSGLILLKAAERLAQRLYERTGMPVEKCRRQVVENSIFGIDIDPVACMIAEYSLKKYCDHDVSTHILNKDALLQPIEDLFPGGFDAVITNPPYIGERGHAEIFRKYYANRYISRYCEGKMDLWYLFAHLSLDSSKIAGILATDYWEYAKGAKLLRERVNSRSRVLYSFKASLFKDAPGVHSQILLLNTTASARYSLKEELRPICGQISRFTADMFVPEQVKRTVRAGLTLGEITRISQGVVPGPDRISRRATRRFKQFSSGEPVFVLPKDHPLLASLSELELRALRPFAYPKQLRPITTKLKPEHRIIDIRGSEAQAEYPNILKHLQQYRELLESRRETRKGVRHWYELHWPRHRGCFAGNRIVSVRQTRSPLFCLLETECCFDLSVNIIEATDLDLLQALAVYLNTWTVKDFLRAHGKMKGDIFQVDSEPLKSIPVPEALLSETQMRERLKNIYRACSRGLDPASALAQAEIVIRSNSY